MFPTTDGGRSWKRKEFLVSEEYDVYFSNRNKGWLVDTYCGKLYRTLDGGETWSLHPTLGEGDFPYLIRFKDAQEGVIIGKHSLFKTSDGGDNWISMPIDFPHFPLEFDFAGDEGLWMVNFNEAVGTLDWVRHSDDGGVTWQSLHEGVLGDFLDVDFLNLERGWVLGNQWNSRLGENEGLILGTRNGGRKWYVRAILPDHLVSLDMVNEGVGWVVAGRYNGDLQRYEGAIYHTRDDWESWQRVELVDQLPFEVLALDSLHAWVCGAEGLLLGTADGGQKWRRGIIYSPDSSTIWLHHICFVDTSLGWATASQSTLSMLLQTRDGGLTWNVVWKSEEEGLSEIVFVDSLRGWAAERSVHHTTDGGHHWVQQHPPLPWENLIGLCFADSIHGWAMGQYGNMICTTSGGQTWLEQPRLVEGLTAMTFVDPAHGWVVGYGGKILYTAQSGLSGRVASGLCTPPRSEVATSF
jgi:photosystem II stability/assembly factor-like uncharacterized protein